MEYLSFIVCTPYQEQLDIQQNRFSVLKFVLNNCVADIRRNFPIMPFSLPIMPRKPTPCSVCMCHYGF